MSTRALVKGLLTFIPGVESILPKRKIRAFKRTPSYFYAIWMKHLTMLHHYGMTRIPETVAELGPGGSIGVGLCSLLSGANKYYALDVTRRASTEFDLIMFDGLVDLFRQRAPTPAEGFPNFRQYLGEDLFPHDILTPALLANSLSDERIASIRRALTGHQSSITIEYMVPWSDDSVVREGSVDLVLSHSVLEHVVDLDFTYDALSKWLKPGGRMTHQVDFTSHGLSREWNGYRAYPEFLWKAMMGRRPYLINRAPVSVHRNLVLQNGFDLLCELRNVSKDGIKRERLAKMWRDISDDDLECNSAFIQAKKVGTQT